MKAHGENVSIDFSNTFHRPLGLQHVIKQKKNVSDEFQFLKATMLFGVQRTEYCIQNRNFMEVFVVLCFHHTTTHIVYEENLCQLKYHAHNFVYPQQKLAVDYCAAGYHPVFVILQ